jgi:hypothetical protein
MLLACSYRFQNKKPYIKSRFCRGVPGMFFLLMVK